MSSIKFLFCLAALVACVSAAEKGKCAKEHNVEQSDFDQLKKDPEHPAEKILCFFKCNYEASGSINDDKTVNADKLVEHVEAWRKLKDSTKTEIKECVGKLTTTVNTCQDVKPYSDCVHKAVGKELKGE